MSSSVSQRPALPLPQALVRVLLVCLCYAVFVAVLQTLATGFLPAPVVGALALLLFPVGLVVTLGLAPWLLWLMGDRAPVRLVLGGLAGVAATYAAVWSQYLLRRAALGAGSDPTVLSAQSGVFADLVPAVVGVIAIGMALYLSRHAGFDDRTMGVDGVLGQPERYSPVASASARASFVLGAAMLLIVAGVTVGLPGGLDTNGAVYGGLGYLAMSFASVGSRWLLIAGIVSLALVGLHGFRRGPARTDPVGS